MLRHIKYYFKMAYCFTRLSTKRQMESLLWFTCFLIALPIRCITGLVIIYVLVDKFSPMYGWSYEQLVFLYGLSYISDGLTSTFGAQVRRIESFVIRGDFDRFLVRPLSVIFQLFFKFIYLVGFMEVASGGIVLAYACRKVGFVLSAVNITKLVFVIIGATLIRLSILVVIGSIAFWTKRSATLIWITDGIILKTTQYPISIYPEIFRALFTFILPFGFVSFYPCTEFFKFGSQFNLPLNFAFWTPVIGFLTLVLAIRVFERGLGKYESAGM